MVIVEIIFDTNTKLVGIFKSREGELLIQEYIITEEKILEEKIRELKLELKAYPEGEFTYRRNGKYIKWYKKKKGDFFYIPKKNRKLAEQLAIKKYLENRLLEYEEEKRILYELSKDWKLGKEKECNMLTEEPVYSELLKTYFSLTDNELQEWMNQEYKTNDKYPENKIYKSISGNILRSKSEVLIDMELYKNKIPFRYECELQLGEVTVYPDFMIKHPRTGKIYYWEHFGMMDKKEYVQNACIKLQQYIQAGYIPGVNLIITFESSFEPINLVSIEKIIQDIFG